MVERKERRPWRPTRSTTAAGWFLDYVEVTVRILQQCWESIDDNGLRRTKWLDVLWDWNCVVILSVVYLAACYGMAAFISAAPCRTLTAIGG